VVSLFTPKPNRKVVEEAFACYDEKVMVSRSKMLGDNEE
jgi:SSS family solute:Na+ symporter